MSYIVFCCELHSATNFRLCATTSCRVSDRNRAIFMEQNNNVMTEVTSLIRSWEEEHSQANYDPVPTLTRFVGAPRLGNGSLMVYMS